MKNYFKLVSFELWRFKNVYVTLIAITVISQLVGTYLIANQHIKTFEKVVQVNNLSVTSFLEQYGKISLHDITNSGWFLYPVMITAVGLLFYSIFIWYRDWLGKNTFIYRLLMIPTARINIFFSKATAIFIMVLAVVALQIILLMIEGRILQLMVPANLRIDLSVMELTSGMYNFLNLSPIIPNNFIDFLTHYGIGFMFVFVLFTAILFERSFGKIGIIYGLVYGFGSLMLFSSPIFFIYRDGGSLLYPKEVFTLYCILWVVIMALSVWVSSYLLNKKITV